MRKSARALLGMVLLDLLIAAGTGWFVMQVRTGALVTAAPPERAIGTITTIGGSAIGVATAVLLVAFFAHRKRGD